MSSLYKILPLCLVVASVGSYATSTRAADGEAIIAQIRADWMERFHATETFMYHASGDMIIFPGTLVHRSDPNLPEEYRKTGYPVEQLSFPYERTWSVDPTQSLLRLDVHETIFDVSDFKPIERWKVEAYDGQTLWTGEPDSAERVILQPSSRANWFYNILDLPVFLAHGLVPIDGITYQNLAKDAATSVSLKYVGEAIIDGRECQVVDCHVPNPSPEQLDVVHRFYVDLARQSAVLRCDVRVYVKVPRFDTIYYNESPSRWLVGDRLEIDYHKQSGLWIPQTWRNTVFSANNAVIMPDGSLYPPPIYEIIRFDDVTATINQPLKRSLFDQPTEAGTIVVDKRDKSAETFQVAEDGRTLVPVSRVPRGTAPGSLMAYVLAGIGLIFLVVAAIVLFRSGTVRGR